MPLVEIIPSIQTSKETSELSKSLITDWGKTVVLCKDTPGFIVNRVARPFYGEALRIYEEGLADFATIDWALKELGGFKMGPFTLMDYIGNDVNFAVTESVFQAFFYANKDEKRGQSILDRILCLLINEAVDAVFMGVATPKDVDLAMTKGVNYPKGLLQWGDEIGLEVVLGRLQDLFDFYGEDRYRPNPLLRSMVKEKKKFYN